MAPAPSQRFVVFNFEIRWWVPSHCSLPACGALRLELAARPGSPVVRVTHAAGSSDSRFGTFWALSRACHRIRPPFGAGPSVRRTGNVRPCEWYTRAGPLGDGDGTGSRAATEGPRGP